MGLLLYAHSNSQPVNLRLNCYLVSLIKWKWWKTKISSLYKCTSLKFPSTLIPQQFWSTSRSCILYTQSTHPCRQSPHPDRRPWSFVQDLRRNEIHGWWWWWWRWLWHSNPIRVLISFITSLSTNPAQKMSNFTPVHLITVISALCSSIPSFSSHHTTENRIPNQCQHNPKLNSYICLPIKIHQNKATIQYKTYNAPYVTKMIFVGAGMTHD